MGSTRKKGFSNLSNWDIVQELRILLMMRCFSEAHLAMEFDELAKKEEIAWRQRSRVK